MKNIFILVRKDIALFRRDRVSISLTFLVPFFLIYLFGQVFHVNSEDPGPSGIPIAVVNQSSNPAARKLVDAMKAEKAFKVVTQRVNPDKTTRPLEEGDLRVLMQADQFRFALVIPADVIRTDAVGVHLKTYSNPKNEIEAQTVNGILQKTLFSNVPELLGQSLQERAKLEIGKERMDRFNESIATAVASSFGGDPQKIKADLQAGYFGVGRVSDTGAGSADSSKTRDFLSKIVKVDDVQVAGKGIKSPMATMLVGGWAMQFLLFALTGSATALFRERELGIFERILSSPVSRSDILWSKFTYGVCLGLFQLLVLFLAGHILYGIEIGGQLPHLVLVCVFAAAACTSFGMLIASLSPTAEAARGISTFVILVTCAVGGAWFPVSFMPEFIQKLSRLTLVYWSMEAFSQVLWSHAALPELLPSLGYLSAMTCVILALAVWRFNRGKIFE